VPGREVDESASISSGPPGAVSALLDPPGRPVVPAGRPDGDDGHSVTAAHFETTGLLPDRVTARRRRNRARRVLLVAPPVGAFLFAELLLLTAALIDGRARYFLEPAHWARYDSGIYLRIAVHGYNLTPCAGPAYPPHSWCGTAGWAPLYPGLIAFFGHLGLSLPVAGMLLTMAFAYGTLQALWVLIGPAWSFERLSCLALGACFPGMVYLYAIFPVSLLTLLSVLCLLCFVRRRFLLAGCMGALAAWAFATGPLLALVLLVAALLVERGPDLWRVVARTAGVVAAGFVALLLLYQVWVGDWRAYFMTSAKYGDGLHDPVATFVTSFTGRPLALYALQDPNAGYQHLVPKLQTAFVAALVIGLVVWTLRRRPVARFDRVLLSYTVVVWIVPLLAGASLSRYRMEALLLPSAALCTRLPRVVLVPLVAVSAVLAIGLAVLFTRSQII